MNNSKSTTKKWIATLLLCILGSLSPLCAQDEPVFEGDWRGTIKEADGKKFQVRIIIEDGEFTQFFKGEAGWIAKKPEISYLEELADIVLAGWLNQGGIWTENQTFSLSYVSVDKLKVVWTRHVTNRQDGEKGEPWTLRGEGMLKRAK